MSDRACIAVFLCGLLALASLVWGVFVAVTVGALRLLGVQI